MVLTEELSSKKGKIIFLNVPPSGIKAGLVTWKRMSSSKINIIGFPLVAGGKKEGISGLFVFLGYNIYLMY